ncbi:hypothetical protein MPSEU_000797000 [Mayamaea pseudoterrestris]|nr:hypothetical protein MPSEU_000797000 [Mayamaea pseudoterrestris]
MNETVAYTPLRPLRGTETAKKTVSVILLLLSAFFVHVGHAQQEVTVREIDTTYASMYPGITAAQGLLIPGNGVEINCMQPPQPRSYNVSSKPSKSLCSVPNWLYLMEESKKESLQITDPHPICLVVSGNETDCPLEQQVKMTQEIQDKVSDRVKCLVVYGNNPDIYELPIQNYAVAVIYVPPLAGKDILTRMNQLANSSNTSSFFFDPLGDNVDWSYAFQVQPYGGPGQYYDGRSNNFFWFRIVLFTLLIISPCLRAGYLWYSGGGRVHLRRNESGRIVGFQVVPPMPHWLSSGVIIRPTEPVSTILTEEQFNSLPTTTYQPAGGQKSDNDDDDRADIDLGATAVEENQLTTSMPQTRLVNDLEQAPAVAVAANSSSFVPEQAAAGANGSSSNFVRTNCTLCSICIDDFELNETLLILPRCQHAFHRSCIHPWLTERQGCCPLCKTNVFEQQQERASAREDEAATAARSELPMDLSGRSNDRRGT